MDIPNGNFLLPEPVPEFQDISIDLGGFGVPWVKKPENERGYSCSFNVYGRPYVLSPGRTDVHRFLQVRVGASVMVILVLMILSRLHRTV